MDRASATELVDPGSIPNRVKSKTTTIDIHSQGRQESNVGPGPAQIWWISGFVNYKTDGEMPQLSELWCDLQKKKSPPPKF